MSPKAQLPRHLEGYGLNDSAEKLLPWSFVAERAAASLNYWVCTVNNRHAPHVRPVWGVWYADELYFGGSPGTRWSRNLAANSQLTVHLEDGTEAVIFEGSAELALRYGEGQANNDEALMTALDDLYEAKYNIRHGPPLWRMLPTKVFAWTSMGTMTKFTFE